MKWYMNMKISTKLVTGFVFVAIFAAVVGIVGILNLQSTVKDFSKLFQVYGVATADVAYLETAYQENRSAIRDILLDRGSTDRQKYVDNIKTQDKTLDEYLLKVKASLQTDEGKKVYSTLSDNINKYRGVRDKVIPLALANQEDQAIELFRSEGNPIGAEIRKGFSVILNLKVTTGNSETDRLTENASTTRATMIVIVVVACLLAVILGIAISRIISKPIGELVVVAEKIADGDLDVTMEAKSRDEIGILSTAFKRMADNLNEVMTNFNSASEQVASGSRQVSASSMALSQGATEQASSIEQLTASIEEISTQTMLNAQNATQANELAEAARENAIEGNQQMKEMLKAMEEINDSSGNIYKIIKVIDEIAFQTNILALNAAVEAARAGQHGKGFAVVAEEVRNLAARSANAAKETTDMIEGSIKKVEGGTKIANNTAEALNKIVEGVTKATNLVAEIATASNEQALGINQVNQGIMQVSSVVQTNSATSEESAAASEELSSQAELLREQVSKFKLRKTNRSFYRGTDDLNPEVLRMLEEMSYKKKGDNNYSDQGYAEAAATGMKPKISLSNNEFGKY